MNRNYTQDLFILQSELVDSKVDMAVGKAIDRVIDKINDLKYEMHDFRHEIKDQLVSLDKRVVAIETRLGIVTQTKKSIFERILDYAFKTGWGLLTLLFAYLITQFHVFVH